MYLLLLQYFIELAIILHYVQVLYTEIFLLASHIAVPELTDKLQ